MSPSIPSPATFSSSVSSFLYRPMDVAPAEVDELGTEEISEPEVRLTETSLSERLMAERAAGFAEAKHTLQKDFETKAEAQAEKISQAISDFQQQRKDYFARVEAEVVQLALAIAGKILHREAQVDPMLVAAIVHLALGQLKEGSAATIRVKPEDAEKWRNHFSSQTFTCAVNVIEDGNLDPGDYVLETELGTVNFSLDAQLKEVERGFFDVLAQKPKV